MTPLEILGCLWIIMFLGWLVSPKERRTRARSRRIKLTRGNVTKFKGVHSLPPVTPGPTYICENCGMLIHTGHGHTRDECEEYDNDPTKPDLRLRRIMKERRKGRNDPPVRKPNYHEPGTFANWGAGKETTL